MNRPPISESLDADSLLADAVDEFMQAQRRGDDCEVEEFLGRYPQIAPMLKDVLPALAMMHEENGGTDRFPFASVEDERQPLGDFRVVREVGRGGMGVVYEAEQLSLGRRVALKVLPFAAALDARRLQRFKAEAQAAAQLQHQNIVPIYAVGCERGVHFYAMQYIDGHPLSAVIADLRSNLKFDDADAGSRKSHSASTPLDLMATVLQTPVGPAEKITTASTDDVVAADTAQANAAVSTDESIRSREYFRSVARLGAQVADALEHAHQLGIVHRDIKPGNLLLDARGTLWVADFGLARVQSDGRLTMTGDILGTLRYMSPEQALRQPGLVDHRTDVYSLGVTLYELLTLEPAFGGEDRRRLLRQIAFEEPVAPGKRNKAVPADLETIVLKAMAKSPAERYQCAQDLRDDLQRYLDDQPIRARRPTLVQRARKWARRHRPVVWSATIAILVILVGLGVAAGWVARDRATRQKATVLQARQALGEVERLYEKGAPREALQAANQAVGLLDEREDYAELINEFSTWQKDLEMVLRLDEIRLRLATETSEVRPMLFDNDGAIAAYDKAFRDYGINVKSLTAAEIAKEVARRRIRQQLVVALDVWAQLSPIKNPQGWPEARRQASRLREAARLASSDSLGNELRDLLAKPPKDFRKRNDLAIALAKRMQQADVSPHLLLQMGKSLQMPSERMEFLKSARRRFPGDFWLNYELGGLMRLMKKQDEAVRYFTAAIALRPDSAVLFGQLADALYQKGDVKEALAAIRKTSDLYLQADPTSAYAYELYAGWCASRKLYRQSVGDYQKAVAAEPKKDVLLRRLAVAQLGAGDLAASRQTIALLIKKFGAVAEIVPPGRATLACMLVPESVSDAERAKIVREIQPLAAKEDPKRYAVDKSHKLPGDRFLTTTHTLSRAYHASLHNRRLAAAQYWAGQYKDAVRTYRKLERISALRGPDRIYFAMALTRLGNHKEALRSFDKADYWFRQAENFKAIHSLVGWYDWEERVVYEHLRREAAPLVLDRKLKQVHRQWNEKEFDDAYAEYSRLVALGLENALLFERCGRYHAMRQEFKQAAENFLRSRQLDPDRSTLWTYEAKARLAAGDVDGYRDVCRGMFEYFKGRKFDDVTKINTNLIEAAIWLPDVVDAAELARLVDDKIPDDNFARHFRGLAACRAGRYKDAVELLSQTTHRPNFSQCFLAMAQVRLNQKDEARAHLEQLERWATSMWENRGKKKSPAGGWFTATLAQRVVKELKGLLADPKPKN